MQRSSQLMIAVKFLHNTHTHPFNGPFSGTTQVSQYQKGKTNLEFTEARDSEWQWHQLGHMQVCTSLQTDNHASTPPLCFLQAGCPSCRPTNSVKALKAQIPSQVTQYTTRKAKPDFSLPGNPRSYLLINCCVIYQATSLHAVNRCSLLLQM